MKREHLTTYLIAAVLAFCVSFGGAACIITGFSMDGHSRFDGVTANIWAVALFCAVFSVAAAVWFSTRWGWQLLAGAAALTLGWLWFQDMLGVGLEALLYRLTATYNIAYGTPVARWTGEMPLSVAPNVGLCMLAALPAAAVAWTVCRRGKAVAAVGLSLLPMTLCTIVTDTVPDNWCIFLLIVGLALLMLTNTVRRNSVREGNRLTALLLVPTVLVASLLFWAVPRKGYTAKAEEMQQMMLSWIEELPFVQVGADGKLNFGFSGTSYGGVNLTTVGQKSRLTYAIMDVTGPKTELLYLRGQSLDVYDGRSWTASEESSGPDNGWPKTWLNRVGEVSITTRAGQPMYFMPYYPDAGYWEVFSEFTEGFIDNPHRQRSYTFLQMELGNAGVGNVFLSGKQRMQNLALPSETRQAAVRILDSMGLTDLAGDNGHIIQRICSYVMNSADYSLDTGRMPQDETDFAIWFLEDSESGYCIHFASAAVVLLRAAGVPARYVTGYVANAVAGEAVTVTADKSHSWVEYFDDSKGWMVLDPTPAEFNTQPDVTEPPQTTEPDITEPPTTTRPTEPSEPDTTEPSQGDTTRPTRPSAGGNETPAEKLDLSWLWDILKVLLWSAGICGAVFGQYFLRLKLRRKKLHTGHPNKRVLFCWQEVRRYCRILRKKPPERLLALAEKARFSQHTMTAAERMEFDAFLKEQSDQLRKMKWYRQWLLRLVWAVE